ncbi:Maf family protein [Nitrospira lenta]|uniref:dTTP/UTP pyrophosphatase n=1 Tax=Nitrospira lenta TaxID=1436998 RepID=A0A330L7N0_9BACT|nr:Maf family protein [Nitrospira lenta]SPP64995.1 Maf-like protein SO_4095 [Nitrospira lenta]
MQLILASTSPRRRELLALLGLPFEIVAPDFEEVPQPGWSPRQQVEHFAREKARSIATTRSAALVLGSDTAIELDGQMLGKPVDLADARAMLTSLAGRPHSVHTAVALCRQTPHHEAVAIETATVQMNAYDEAAIERYLATQEPMGKAGAYSIQGMGGEFIETICGDFLGIVGLPLRKVATLLADTGVPVPVDIEALYRAKPYPNWARFSRD